MTDGSGLVACSAFDRYNRQSFSRYRRKLGPVVPVVPDFPSIRFITRVDATTDAGHSIDELAIPHSDGIDPGGPDDPPDLFCRRCGHAAGVLDDGDQAQAQQAYGRAWGHTYNTMDWDRFYHYPYVYYPQNFWGNEYYRSADSLYFRYPPEMRIPVYNRHWHNYYPTPRPYHRGHHFVLDVF